MNKSNQLLTIPLHGSFQEAELKVFNGLPPDRGNKYTGRFVVETMTKEVLYGDIMKFAEFNDAVEKDKFVRIEGKCIATHQITAFYPEQRRLSDAELMENLIKSNPEKK